MVDDAPRLKKLLRKAGCHLERPGKGDHEIWYSPTPDKRFPVDKRFRSRHTANVALK